MFPRDSQRTVRQRDQDCDVGTGESILVCDSGESFLLRPEELAISGVWQGAYFLQLLRGGLAMIGCIFSPIHFDCHMFKTGAVVVIRFLRIWQRSHDRHDPMKIRS